MHTIGVVTYTLTGNTTYRLQRRLFKPPFVVFQVEEKVTTTYPRENRTESYTRWRDGRPNDMEIIFKGESV